MTKTYPRSRDLYARAGTIAGASLTRSKAPGRLFDVSLGPLYASHGSGAVLYDVDNHPYIDMVCALGAISLGYGEPFSVNAATGQVRSGSLYSLPHLNEVEAADATRAVVAPWASSVRFVKTGSEATHAAYRIAKEATGRQKVLVGNWAYHGWHEWSSYSHVDSGGTSFGSTVSFTHPDDLRTLVNPHEVAAVFVEPPRWTPIDREWLQKTRAFCDDVGALLVFDEMIYGGRWAIGGATEYFGVTPDLACFGKAFGNGAPIAFVVGTDALAEHGELISGTYSGDAVALAALISVVNAYHTTQVIETFWKRGQQLARGLREVVDAFSRRGLMCWREGAAVHQRLRFAQADYGKTFAAAMAARGVLWHPDVINVSAAHTEAQIERVIEAALDIVPTLG